MRAAGIGWEKNCGKKLQRIMESEKCVEKVRNL
jgi:hypothetical protein